MAAKGNTKGIGKDPKLSHLGSRLIHTILREERLAERDLQVKLKDIKAKEHKSMVKLISNSLDVRHDLILQRSSSPIPGEINFIQNYQDGTSLGARSTCLDCSGRNNVGSGLVRPGLNGRRAFSMINYSSQTKDSEMTTERTRSISEERLRRIPPPLKSPAIVIQSDPDITDPEDSLDDEIENAISRELNEAVIESKLCSQTKDETSEVLDQELDSSKLIPCGLRGSRKPLSSVSSPEILRKSCPTGSPLLLRRRALSDSGSFSRSRDQNPPEVTFIEQITRIPSSPVSPRYKGTSSRLDVKSTSQRPTRRADSNLVPEFKTQRPFSALSTRSPSPVPMGFQNDLFPRESEVQTLDKVQSPSCSRRNMKPILTLTRSGGSPSPSQHLSDVQYTKQARPVSGCKVDVTNPPLSSLQQKNLCPGETFHSLKQASPEVVRRHLSAQEDSLKSRVEGFLKSLPQ